MGIEQIQSTKTSCYGPFLSSIGVKWSHTRVPVVYSAAELGHPNRTQLVLCSISVARNKRRKKSWLSCFARWERPQTVFVSLGIPVRRKRAAGFFR
jgi:hypothetical protein